jgi:hypothetical protein
LVIAIAIGMASIVWGVCLYSLVSQIGQPFPGFLYDPDRIVNAFNTEDLTGWQAGLRPSDRIVAVNGQPWREISRIVRAAPIGTPLRYKVERGDQTLEIAVPTMEFPSEIVLRVVPPWLLCALLFLVIGVFVYVRTPAGRLNRYLLVYLLLWATAMATAWEWALSQNKWTAYLSPTWDALATVTGWIFFWSFPADRARKEFLARVPLIPAFVVLGIAATIYFPGLFFLAYHLDQPEWWNIYSLSISWGIILIFAMGCVPNKFFPVLQIALRKGTSPLVRQQALTLFLGIFLGLNGFLVLTWAPLTIHFPQTTHLQWVASLITSLYPLSIGYAVLRYQLFDIRVIIRKGLVYSLLTTALTAIFVILSLVMGYLFQALTGQQSILVALFPALFVAFLFQPARNRIQTLVDRTFFRREVEVRQTLTAFSRGLSTLRETDEVSRLVQQTVTETLGFESAELWVNDKLSSLPHLSAWLMQERKPLLLFPDDRSPRAQDLLSPSEIFDSDRASLG